jgi:hypothetical protein
MMSAAGHADPAMRDAVLREAVGHVQSDPELEAVRLAMIIEDVTGRVLPRHLLAPGVLTDPRRVAALLELSEDPA